MARINGANSDFELKQDGSIQEVKPLPNPLDLNMFICPYDQPNKLQEPSKVENKPYCTGIDTDCPEVSPNNGHALVNLNQTNGITLRTDKGTNLNVDQNGNINLSPGRVGNVFGEVRIKNETKVLLTIKSSGDDMILESSGGARLILKSDGDLELLPASNKKVLITGDLEVEGDISLNGDVDITGTLAVNGTPLP